MISELMYENQLQKAMSCNEEFGKIMNFLSKKTLILIFSIIQVFIPETQEDIEMYEDDLDNNCKGKKFYLKNTYIKEKNLF